MSVAVTGADHSARTPSAGRPLRIGLLSFEYPPETGFGGIGTYTWHHARGLADLGHEVHVLAGAKQATALDSSMDGRVHVHRFWSDGAAMRAFESLGAFKLWWTRQRLQNALSMYRGLRMLHRAHRFDVVEMPECGAEGALVTRRLDIPSVVRLHSPSRLIMGTYDVRRLDIEACSAIEQPALHAATALTSCSRFLADEVTDKLGVLRSIRVITNGLDVGWFDDTTSREDVFAKYGIPRRAVTIVFTGRLERRKGIHLMPAIARRILERYDASLVLAGADLFGYAAQTLLPSLEGVALKGGIHCLGQVPLGDLRPLVAAADVFLLPSIWENCPYSALEAMAAGKAIVCANQGGMPEIVRHGETGLLATCDDAASFASEVERLVADDALRTRLGQAARRAIEASHGHTHVAAQALDVYRRIVHERGGDA